MGRASNQVNFEAAKLHLRGLQVHGPMVLRGRGERERGAGAFGRPTLLMWSNKTHLYHSERASNRDRKREREREREREGERGERHS